MAATCQAVKAASRHTNEVRISFDEWNVWHQDEPTSKPAQQWEIVPRLLEDNYTVSEAVVVGNLLMSLLRNMDWVTAASQAQLVNVIVPIMTEPGGKSWRQTIFHPFALTAQHSRGNVLDCHVDSPRLTTDRYGEVDLIDSVVTHDPDSGECCVLAVNRSESDSVTLEVQIRECRTTGVLQALTYSNDDPE